MNRIKIITDSGADLPKELRKTFNISYFQSSMIVGGMEYPADLDWGEVTPQKLYDTLRNGDRIYMLPATELEIETLLSTYMEYGFDILYIATPMKMSKNIIKVERVAKRLHNTYPDSQVLCIDSLSASLGIGMLAVKAAQLRTEGKTLEEIGEAISALRSRVNQFTTVPTMTYLSRADKIRSPTAFFGDVLDLHPVIISDKQGTQCTYTTVFGWEKTLHRLVSLAAQNVEAPETQTLYIVHADDPRAARQLQDLLEGANLGFRDILVCSLGPVTGTTTGPGTLGVFFYGKEVTYTGR